MWTRRDALRFALGLPSAVALTSQWALAAKDFWDAKPAAEWTSDEIERILTNSPWAKEVRASFNGEPGGFGGGNRGGGMGGGRTQGGIGFPGGGVGFPGGGMGYPGGTNRGGGWPGGSGSGGGWPGGSGGGTPGGRRPENVEPMKATVRWETAVPIQEALNSGSSGSGSRKPNPDFEKYYIVHVLGDIPAFGGRNGRPGLGDPGDPNNRRARRMDDDVDIESRGEQERRLEMLKQYTKLERKDGPIFLERFERGSRTGDFGPGSYFYFSRLDGISMDDKEITFVTKMGPMEVKAKFALKDMVYRGKLTL